MPEKCGTRSSSQWIRRRLGLFFQGLLVVLKVVPIYEHRLDAPIIQFVHTVNGWSSMTGVRFEMFLADGCFRLILGKRLGSQVGFDRVQVLWACFALLKIVHGLAVAVFDQNVPGGMREGPGGCHGKRQSLSSILFRMPIDHCMALWLSC